MGRIRLPNPWRHFSRTPMGYENMPYPELTPAQVTGPRQLHRQPSGAALTGGGGGGGGCGIIGGSTPGRGGKTRVNIEGARRRWRLPKIVPQPRKHPFCGFAFLIRSLATTAGSFAASSHAANSRAGVLMAQAAPGSSSGSTSAPQQSLPRPSENRCRDQNIRTPQAAADHASRGTPIQSLCRRDAGECTGDAGPGLRPACPKPWIERRSASSAGTQN